MSTSRCFQPMLLLVLLLVLAGCGSGSSISSTPPAGVTGVSFSVQDNPPVGVTVLSFEIQVTSANLQPTDSSKPPVALLVRPADVELEHLQSEPALLGNLNVTAGTYSSVTVAFANPRMAIFNNTGAPIPVGTTVCAVKSVCNLTPALTSATTTVNTVPFPITLVSNSPLGLLLHFDVNSSVNSDLLSIAPTIDLKQIVPSTTGVIQQEHLVGTITGISSPDFTLQPGLGTVTPMGLALPPTFLIKTDNNTKYSFVDDLHSTCSPPGNFSCLAVGQTVRVTVNVMSNSSLLATQVSLLEQENEPAYEGSVVSVDAASNQFHMALMGGQWSPMAVPTTSAAVGVLVTVNVTPSTVYEIDTDGFTLPAGLTFNGISDMVAGQTVEIQPSAVSVGPVANTLSLTTVRVRLDETQVTAKVASINTSVTPPSFTLSSLPSLFGSVSTITVQTLATTQFQNVSGVSGLAAGDTVSVGGLLFNTAGTPTLVAETVLKRLLCIEASASGTTNPLPCVF